MISKLSLQYGFNVFELLITLVIVVVTIAMGMPSMQDSISDARMTTLINDFVADMKFARQQAITEGTKVVICRSTNLTACETSGDAWEVGWMVYTDANGDGLFSDATPLTSCTKNSFGELTEDCILKKHEAVEINTVRFNRNEKVVFDYRGFSAGYNGTFVFCDERGIADAKIKTLSQAGRLRTGEVNSETCP